MREKNAVRGKSECEVTNVYKTKDLGIHVRSVRGVPEIENPSNGQGVQNTDIKPHH